MDIQPDRIVERAKERIEAGDPYGAVHLLREVTASGRAFADAHHLLGLAYSMIGQPAEALEEFDRALALNPRYVDAHLNRAVTLNEMGRYDDAVAAFAAAQGLGGVDHTGFPAPEASRLANLHAELAEAYVEAGGIRDAIEQYAKAAELRPEFLDLRYRLARLRLEVGDVALARRELEVILEVRPSFFDARAALGMACYLEGDTAVARAAWQQCRGERPDEPRIRAYLALLDRVAMKAEAGR
ncbi:MAG: tetratricopeptide repeat protein [Gemmatimonadales bacterium]|jgi:tetratricopeptide (TPR) repeat protein